MPAIQNLARSAVQDPQRQLLDDGPLGRVGNLRFKAEPGATPRAPGPNFSQRVGQLLSKIAFHVSASPELRAQQRVLDQTRDNSRRIGNLLGHLTAPSGDPKARSRIAADLARLGALSGGDLSRLPGGKESLNTYLRELSVMDLSALRGGVLGTAKDREAVIGQMAPPRLREQAAQVLDQIDGAMKAELAGRVLQEPLAQIRSLLAASPLDGQALDEPLVRLSSHLSMLGHDTLDVHLQSWSNNDLRSLQGGLHAGPAGLSRQGAATVDHLSKALDKEIQARVDRKWPALIPDLAAAIGQGDRVAIGKALLHLSWGVDQMNCGFGAPPAATARAVREQVALAMDALRDPGSNPAGPLTRGSLARLDDVTLGRLRLCGELSAFGLRLDREDARAEGLARVQALSQQVAESVGDVLMTLAADSPDVQVLVQQLRDLAELEFRYEQHLTRLGHYGGRAGADDLGRTARQTVRQALDSLGDIRDEIGQRAGRHLRLLRGLEEGFGNAFAGLGAVLAELRDCPSGAMAAFKRLSLTQQLLGSIRHGLQETLARQAGSTGDFDHIEPIMPPDSFYTMVTEQYGVRYDPAAHRTMPVLTDAMGASMAPHVEEPVDPGLHPTYMVTLPVHGTHMTFPVGKAFFHDSVERVTFSLSVRGSDASGAPVRTTWPRTVAADQHAAHMGEAVDALFAVAGPAAEPLTRLMNQQLGGGILNGVLSMGKDGPFRLEDGTTVLPGAHGGSFHCDLEKEEDGSFRVVATMKLPLDTVPALDRDGNTVLVSMDRSASWALAQVTLDVSSDGLRFRMSEPPQFRHHFERTPPKDV
ncbi:hypothetical protein [Castellaniella defragrans]|uniref:Uncharacterized protein n=1 Tax=Castellaniella defragrans TaxID=75697 RepID=A0A7W9TQC1_CASDE|nr:hypothetical protein [Castellaniella defragrans]KAB0614666.1 hypothetical protein F7Q88_09750 [Castellaniella defragrans]MBB6084938.1 hypothetical protein [Castellaniella defragrans]